MITKTYLYNFDPLKPHFYIVNLGLQGYILFFLFLLKNVEAVLTSTYNLCFEQEYEKYQNFLFENYQVLVVKFSVYLNRRVFVMVIRRAGYYHKKASRYYDDMQSPIRNCVMIL